MSTTKIATALMTFTLAFGLGAAHAGNGNAPKQTAPKPKAKQSTTAPRAKAPATQPHTRQAATGPRHHRTVTAPRAHGPATAPGAREQRLRRQFAGRPGAVGAVKRGVMAQTHRQNLRGAHARREVDRAVAPHRNTMQHRGDVARMGHQKGKVRRAMGGVGGSGAGHTKKPRGR